jgi:hypothetical protein
MPGITQRIPHAPQCSTETRVSTSHPFAAFPSQSAKPALQRPIRHEPITHDAEALAKLHALPQRPQCTTLVSMFVSQPVAGVPSQSPKPAVHVVLQPPATQVVPGQTLAQRPQCEGLDARDTHAPSQHVSPAAQRQPESTPGTSGASASKIPVSSALASASFV